MPTCTLSPPPLNHHLHLDSPINAYNLPTAHDPTPVHHPLPVPTALAMHSSYAQSDINPTSTYSHIQVSRLVLYCNTSYAMPTSPPFPPPFFFLPAYALPQYPPLPSFFHPAPVHPNPLLSPSLYPLLRHTHRSHSTATPQLHSPPNSPRTYQFLISIIFIS